MQMELEEREKFTDFVKGIGQTERDIGLLTAYLNHPKKDKELTKKDLAKKIKKKKRLEKEFKEFKQKLGINKGDSVKEIESLTEKMSKEEIMKGIKKSRK